MKRGGEEVRICRLFLSLSLSLSILFFSTPFFKVWPLTQSIFEEGGRGVNCLDLAVTVCQCCHTHTHTHTNKHTHTHTHTPHTDTHTHTHTHTHTYAH